MEIHIFELTDPSIIPDEKVFISSFMIAQEGFHMIWLLRGANIRIAVYLVIGVFLSQSLFFTNVEGAGSSTGTFESDHAVVSIPTNESIGLTEPMELNWRTPFGVSDWESLTKVVIFSDEGHVVGFDVEPMSLDAGGIGINVTGSHSASVPKSILEMIPTDFMGPVFIAVAGGHLYELNVDTYEVQKDLTIGFRPQYLSNLWNRWNLLESQGIFLYAMADERSVLLYAKVPPNPAYGEYHERTFGKTVDLSDYTETSTADIIGDPIVLDVPLVENGSLIVVPTTDGIAALELVKAKSFGRITDIDIGKMVWFVSYDAIGMRWGRNVVPIANRPITITEEDPREQLGKDRIILAAESGHLYSVLRSNGTMEWSTSLAVSDIKDPYPKRIYPTDRGDLIAIGRDGRKDFIAIIDPKSGEVRGNGTWYIEVPSRIEVRPDYVQSTREYVLNTVDGVIYILKEDMDLTAEFKVPHGISTPASCVGNIINNIGTTQGYYFAVVTKKGELHVQSLTGVYHPGEDRKVSSPGFTVFVMIASIIILPSIKALAKKQRGPRI